MSKATREYDAVVIGGGHNGLVAACYLAGAGPVGRGPRAGSVVGGAAVTEELIPGFRVSTGSYVLSLMPRRILDELDLWSAGLQYLAARPPHLRAVSRRHVAHVVGRPGPAPRRAGEDLQAGRRPLRGLRGVHRAGGDGDGPVHPPEPALVGARSPPSSAAPPTSRSSRSASSAPPPTSPSTSSRARSSRPSWRRPGSSARSAARGTRAPGTSSSTTRWAWRPGIAAPGRTSAGAMGAVTQALARVADGAGRGASARAPRSRRS